LAVVLFDGVCNLCNAWVRFVVERDRAGRFQFAPLQSAAAARLLGGRATSALDSLVLVTDGRILTRSSAAIEIARGLGFPWHLAAALLVVPRPVRDAVYDFIARRRYRWFGKRDVCMIPGPEHQGRFLS
jgi:predicted DCC family thiol-disulfide oxidoreductase YuxK